jgi:hypothetical protein
VSHANVSKLGLNFSMLQSLIFDVADVESRCCKHVVGCCKHYFFNVADIAFRCCRHVVLGVVLRRREKRLLMLDVARNTGRNMTAIWSQHGRNMGEERRTTPNVGCCKQPRSQHARNIYLVVFRSNG